MIHPALRKLLRMLMRAKFRWMFRGERSARNIIFICIGGAVLLLSLSGAVIDHLANGRRNPDQIRVYLPTLLLTFCIANLVSAAGERAIAFNPAESDFLFPGPFTRRELLLYKISKSAGAAALSALIFGTFFWNYAPSWAVSYFACLLSLLFLQLLSIVIMLIALNISERVLNRVRRFILFGVIAVLAFSAEPIIAAARNRDAAQLAIGLRQSVGMRVILKPFEVFGSIIAAPRFWPDAAIWIGVAIAMLIALLAAVLLLDTQYMDAAATAGRRRYELIRRARTRGIALRPTNSRARSPMLPRLAGIGPIAWRQLTTALRQSRGVLTLLVMISVGAGIFVFTRREPGQSYKTMFGVVMWASVMLANTLRFDFRGDVDLMDVLKALPLAPITICAGEIVAPALVMTIFHLAVIIMAMIALPGKLLFLIPLAILAVPANFVIFAVENLMFLLFPVRFATAAPGDLQGSGRMMIVMFLKMIAVVLVVTSAAGIGAIVQWFSASWLAGFAAMGVVLIVEIIALLTAMAAAFTRFDPHVHTPT